MMRAEGVCAVVARHGAQDADGSLARVRSTSSVARPTSITRADDQAESESVTGANDDVGRVEGWSESDAFRGPSDILAGLCATWEDIQKTRIAAQLRGHLDLAAKLKVLEDATARQVKRELMAQPVWPWLAGFPGLGGVHVARLVAIIGDARRFPGQKCSEGHTLAPDYTIGDPCPVEDCAGAMVAPRTTTGTRSLWHYCGLHVDSEGHAPKKRKGQRIDWNTDARTACLMPGGIAEQIVRLRVPVYRERYDVTKARLATRAEGAAVIDTHPGPQGGTQADVGAEIALESGLRPFHLDKIARTVAVKAFVGDLLREMKHPSGPALTVAPLPLVQDQSGLGGRSTSASG